jgi:hypothetical protein
MRKPETLMVSKEKILVRSYVSTAKLSVLTREVKDLLVDFWLIPEVSYRIERHPQSLTSLALLIEPRLVCLQEIHRQKLVTNELFEWLKIRRVCFEIGITNLSLINEKTPPLHRVSTTLLTRSDHKIIEPHQ